LAVGFCIGIPGWIWGQSPVPALALKLVSGFGWPLILLLVAAVILFLMDLYLKGTVGHLAYGDFQNIFCWIHPNLMRATFVIFGLVLTAAACWIATGSINAIKTVFLGFMLSGALFFYWCGLALIANELSKRFASANR
jgi:hypothetical protein